MSKLDQKGHEKIKLEDEKRNRNDDITKATFELSSQIIQIPYLNLLQHSRIVQEEFKHNDIFEGLSSSLKSIQKKNKIFDSIVITFFRLLNNEEVELKDDEISKLLKLTGLFKIDALSGILQNFIRKHAKDVEFVLSLKISQEENEDENLFLEDEFSAEMEKCLSENINECLESEKLEKISVSSVYRMIEKSRLDELNCESLYRFISQSIEKRHVLMRFVEVEKLSDESFAHFCVNYERNLKENNNSYYEYLPSSISYIKKLREEKQILKSKIEALEEKLNECEIKNKRQNEELTNINQELKARLNNEIKQKEDGISKLTKTNQELNSQLNNEIKQKEEEISKLTKTNQQLKEEIKQKDDQIYELNKKQLENKKKEAIKNQSMNESNDIKKIMNNKIGIHLISLKNFLVDMEKLINSNYQKLNQIFMENFCIVQ